MSVTQKMNSKGNIKRFTAADLPVNPRQPVIARMTPVESTAGQTVINLPWTVDTVNAQDSFFLAIDGKLLSIGAANDFTMTSVDVLGFSSQVTLNVPLVAGLNIQAWKQGLKKESEFAQDQRFVNLYDYNDKAFQGFVDTSSLMTATTTTGSPAAGTFYSSITNRASMPDMRQDLRSRMAIERITTHALMLIQNEFGPNGENVYGVLSDSNAQVRLVGTWTNQVNASGHGVQSNTVNDFVEITFYGTGLNLLSYYDTNNSDYRVSVDGGAEGANVFTAGKTSVLANRGYPINGITPLASGLTLGVHTIKIRMAAIVLNMSGLEILNESTLIKTNPGIGYNQGKKITTAAQDATSYTVGVTGVRGGRMVTYQGSDGVIGRVFNPAGTQGNLTGADHSNEEVIRTYSPREFGAQRSDDFTSNAAGAKAFTLDDGTTCLIASANNVIQPSTPESIFPNNASDFWTFTFVGTGLDIFNASSGVVAGIYTILVDGVAIGTGLTGYPAQRIIKIVSGLPYGTHTVKLLCTTNTGNALLTSKWVVYGPKKPSIPSGAIELADHNVMAAQSVNVSTAANESIVSGALRKSSTKEVMYYGTWSAGLDTSNFAAGFNVQTTTPASFYEYTFLGTGIEIGYYCAAGSINTSFGLAVGAGGAQSNNLSTSNPNWPAIVTSLIQPGSGLTFTNTTGALAGSNTSGGRIKLKISGLPYGLYTLRGTQNAAAISFQADVFDVLVPIHVNKINRETIQNTIQVGSCGISDTRKVTANKDSRVSEKAWSQALGITGGATTTLTTYIPIPDMNVGIKTSGGHLHVNYVMQVSNNTSGNFVGIRIFINGTFTGIERFIDVPNPNNRVFVTDSYVFPVPAGIHKVEVQFATQSGSTGSMVGNVRSLTVRET